MAVANHRQIKLAPGWIVQYSQKLRHQIRLDRPPFPCLMFKLEKQENRFLCSASLPSPPFLSFPFFSSPLLLFSPVSLFSLLLPLSSLLSLLSPLLSTSLLFFSLFPTIFLPSLLSFSPSPLLSSSPISSTLLSPSPSLLSLSSLFLPLLLLPSPSPSPSVLSFLLSPSQFLLLS